ncbi:hypothetical protein C9374_004351 [Naegleria lovaniensis]|uniref:Uncharacterized protein n=1 Tax=Naegleria lovaniensis TaxID=51637 RepID=A0AA88GNI4_NAELO|nr:uncharacterized protein C9374_004351 [Naegleria lovaniensis]KAG2383680.1 hypothetical protein C9374_004351 [Naegleria lovaniensis]
MYNRQPVYQDDHDFPIEPGRQISSYGRPLQNQYQTSNAFVYQQQPLIQGNRSYPYGGGGSSSSTFVTTNSRPIPSHAGVPSSHAYQQPRAVSHQSLNRHQQKPPTKIYSSSKGATSNINNSRTMVKPVGRVPMMMRGGPRFRAPRSGPKDDHDDDYVDDHDFDDYAYTDTSSYVDDLGYQDTYDTSTFASNYYDSNSIFNNYDSSSFNTFLYQNQGTLPDPVTTIPPQQDSQPPVDDTLQDPNALSTTDGSDPNTASTSFDPSTSSAVDTSAFQSSDHSSTTYDSSAGYDIGSYSGGGYDSGSYSGGYDSGAYSGGGYDYSGGGGGGFDYGGGGGFDF